MAIWTDPTGASVAIYSVDGSAGIMTLDNIDSEGTQLLIGSTTEECEVTFVMDWVTGGAGTMTPGVYYRAASDLSTFFKVQFTIDLDLLTNDEITNITVRSEDGVIGTVAVSKVHTIGVPFNVKVRSTSAHFVKVWAANVAEPADWDLTTGSGSSASGVSGLTATVALDAPVPSPIDNVLWLWGVEQGVSGYGSTSFPDGSPLVNSAGNIFISPAGAGRDGIGYAANIVVTGATRSISLQSSELIGLNTSQYTLLLSVRFNGSLPTGGTSNHVLLHRLAIVSLAAGIDLAFRTTDSKLVVVPSNAVPGTVAEGPVVTTNTWYSIEMAVDMTTSTFVIDWSVNGVTQPQATRTGVTSPPRIVQSITLGPSVGNTTCAMYFDDMMLVSGINQYPIGDVRIVKLLPVATIVESGTANVWCRFTSNGSVLDTTFNAANILAAVASFPPDSAPIASSDGVYQRTSGLSVGAITLPMDTYTLTAGQGVGAVRLETLVWQSTSGGSDYRALANVGGSNTVLWNVTAGGGIVGTNQVWVCEIYTPSGGWDQTKLNALQLIFDGGADITPLPGYRFGMAEVAVRTSNEGATNIIDIEFDDFQVCSCEPE